MTDSEIQVLESTKYRLICSDCEQESIVIGFTPNYCPSCGADVLASLRSDEPEGAEL